MKRALSEGTVDKEESGNSASVNDLSVTEYV